MPQLHEIKNSIIPKECTHTKLRMAASVIITAGAIAAVALIILFPPAGAICAISGLGIIGACGIAASVGVVGLMGTAFTVYQLRFYSKLVKTIMETLPSGHFGFDPYVPPIQHPTLINLLRHLKDSIHRPLKRVSVSEITPIPDPQTLIRRTVPSTPFQKFLK